MDIFNIDNLLNDIPNEAVIDNPRSRTPAPYEHDAIMSPSFDTSPQVPRRAPSATRDMSPEISSQVPVFNIEHSETADTNKANSTTIQGTDDAVNVPNNPREPLSEDPHNSRGRVELEPPVQRPARAIVEDTSYDDDESIIGASAPLKSASRLPDSEHSRKVEVFGPFQSIFGGGPLIGNKTSTGQPRKAMTTVRKTPIVIDDDDDIIVIEQETASQEARNRWSSQRKRKVPSTGFHKEVIPKKEKTNDVSFSNSHDNSQFLSPPPTQPDTQSQNSEYLHQLPQNTIVTPNASQVFESRNGKDAQSNPSHFQKNKDIMSIIAAQQAMVNKGQSRHNSPFPFQVQTSLASRVPAPRPSEAESSSAAAARNPAPFVSRLTLPRIPEKVTSPLEASQHDPAQMDFSVRQPREDHSWMEEGCIEDETYEDLIRKGDVLGKKEKAGTLNPEQKMVLFKIRRDIELKERLMAAARHAVEREEEEDGEDSLFVPDRRDPPRRIHSTQNHGLADDSDNGERDIEHQHEGLYRMMQEEFWRRL